MSDEKETPAPCPECSGSGKRDVLHRGTDESHRVTCPCKVDLPIKFVWQPEKAGCGVAVLAMVSGKTYLQARQYFTLERDFTEQGMHNGELEGALFTLGFAVQIFTPTHARLGYSKRTEWPMKPVSGLAICQVKNLRDSVWHYVVVLRDGRVLDPAFGVIQGLHRYPEVCTHIALYHVPEKAGVSAVTTSAEPMTDRN